jgi:acyl carrier protein
MERNMSATAFDVITGIIVDVCGLDRAQLAPGANAVDDLGIDSVDFLDIIYEIDRHFGIKLPAEAWMEQINAGKATTADFFVLERFAANVEAHAQLASRVQPSA